MTILYIGPYSPGTTTHQRGLQLKKLFQNQGENVKFIVIDTHKPFFATSKLWRSLGFRLKIGSLITNINKYIIDEVEKSETENFDIIWMDKAVFVTPKTTLFLKAITKCMAHFTPDMAFYGNRSHYFYKSLKYYDFFVTTKSAEISHYQSLISPSKLILTTQGYDKDLHKPLHTFEEKDNTVSFIGLCEPSREAIIQKLLNHHISVKLAGKGWKSFLRKNINNQYLSYHGEALFGNNYVQFISSSLMCLGLLSKKFPELHTTRTFEIPACGTALITERNEETTRFFNEDEAIFYSTSEELVERILYYQAHPEELETLTIKGRERVIHDGRDYRSIIKGVLEKMGVMM